MSITERLPGMEPGSTLRNMVVGYGYFLGALLAFAFLPLVVGVAVGTNYRGVADKAARLPGVAPSGGAKSGASAGAYALVLWVVLIGSGAAGETDGDGTGTAVGDDSEANADVSVEENSPEEVIAAWFETHESDLGDSNDHLSDGDNAYNSERYSQAVYHYQNAFEIVERIKEDTEGQVADAPPEMRDYWNTVKTYFSYRVEFVASHYLAASEMSDGNQLAAEGYVEDAGHYAILMEEQRIEIDEWLNEAEAGS